MWLLLLQLYLVQHVVLPYGSSQIILIAGRRWILADKRPFSLCVYSNQNMVHAFSVLFLTKQAGPW